MDNRLMELQAEALRLQLECIRLVNEGRKTTMVAGSGPGGWIGPKPAAVDAYTAYEGDKWRPIRSRPDPASPVHAIRLADGWIWDVVTGWRHVSGIDG